MDSRQHSELNFLYRLRLNVDDEREGEVEVVCLWFSRCSQQVPVVVVGNNGAEKWGPHAAKGKAKGRHRLGQVANELSAHLQWKGEEPGEAVGIRA
jgi:hypothetical protein